MSGTPVDAAYRDAGITLPPPGTPVTAPIDPSSLTCGAIGMFKDHYVVAVNSSKALDSGQVVPLFIGHRWTWIPGLDGPGREQHTRDGTDGACLEWVSGTF